MALRPFNSSGVQNRCLLTKGWGKRYKPTSCCQQLNFPLKQSWGSAISPGFSHLYILTKFDVQSQAFPTTRYLSLSSLVSVVWIQKNWHCFFLSCHWKELSSIFFTPFLLVFVYIDENKLDSALTLGFPYCWPLASNQTSQHWSPSSRYSC